eukprot:Sspe_Gene.82757::Locus_54247_Transcript_1_1_Confidence_1.000_Length_2329::g.82757::m.82757
MLRQSDPPNYGTLPLPSHVLGEGKQPPVSQLRLGSLSSVAIPLSYFAIGIAQTLSSAPLQFYLLNELDVSASRLSVLGPVTTLPWCCKILYGILSDYHPMFGERRRPYLCLGWMVYCMACLAFAVSSRPSFFACVILVAVQVFAYILAVVMADTMVVERSKVLEDAATKGEMQATCYLLRFTGSLLGALGGAFFGDPSGAFHMQLSEIFLMCAVSATVPLVAAVFLKEASPENHAELPAVSEILDTVSHRAVWRPMIFIYVFNILQIGNGAWPNFLTKGLGFREEDLGLLTLAGSTMTWLGILLYRRYLIHASWRGVYLACTLVTVTFGLTLQLTLAQRRNGSFGVGDLTVAVADASIQQLSSAIRFLPAVNMFISMCPDGAEGTTFALLTTFSNIAG